MSCCSKGQKEVDKDGKEIVRCVNPKTQVYLAIVEPTKICNLCPLRTACKSQPKDTPTQMPYQVGPNYEYCEYRIYKDDKPTCSVTGLPVTPEQCKSCCAETRDRVATLGDKLFGYASAIQRWVAAGRPVRTEEEQTAILNDHCLKCEMYDKEKHSCKNCGCSLAQTGNPLTSKVAMGTESCPLGRW